VIAVTTVLPDDPTDKPLIVLVHGAANSALVWTFWQRELAAQGWPSHAIDLRGHGRSDPIDLSTTSMDDYASDVRSIIRDLPHRAVVMGWSMGGLVAMMVAAAGDAIACVALAPSTPSRTRDRNAAIRAGTFGAEFYGIRSDDPDDQPAMPDLDREERVIALSSLGQESQLARDDRKAGIVIDSMPCPLMIVTGSEDRLWPRNKYDALWLPNEQIEIEGASHWGLVLSRRALETARVHRNDITQDGEGLGAGLEVVAWLAWQLA
jgi:pimeloyl-ACP methyl ester carboxylesterase